MENQAEIINLQQERDKLEVFELNLKNQEKLL